MTGKAVADRTNHLERYATYGPFGEEQPETSQPYGQPGFPNLDPRAYFQPPDPDSGTGLQNFARHAPWALMGLGPRPMPTGSAATALRVQKLPRKPDGEAVGQSVYEAILGRPPGGAPGSGHWNANGRFPIPKSPLAWLLMGAGGYGGWKVGDKIFGAEQAWEDLNYRREHGVFPGDDPNHVRYDRERHEWLAQAPQRYEERRRQHLENTEYGFRRGLEGPVSIFGDRPLSRFAPEPLPGAPY